MPIDFDALWRDVAAQFALPIDSIHGPDHWRRVERNGLFLAHAGGADLEVVRLFAIFHDCQRQNEFTDPDHGARGAAHAALRRTMLHGLSDERFALLQDACTRHTDGTHSEEPTIAACWDADRLDLGRAGMTPKEKFMSTELGRHIVRNASAMALAELSQTVAVEPLRTLAAR